MVDQKVKSNNTANPVYIAGRTCYKIASKLYVFIFGRASTQFLNNILFQMALRARGYNSGCDLESSGEANFIAMISKMNPMLCIDVGANKGSYSKRLMQITNASVVAFEPLASAFKALKNLEYEYSGRFKAENLGLSFEEAKLDLNFGLNNSTLASFSNEINDIPYVGRTNSQSVSVSVTTLDRYAENYLFERFSEIDLLKIDTEGFEYEILMGASETIKKMRPKFIQVEFNWHQLFRGHSMLKISRLLDGYLLYQLLPYGRGLVLRDVNRPESNIFHYSNFIFVRNDIMIS